MQDKKIHTLMCEKHYKYYIIPHFDYCLSVWGSVADKNTTTLTKLICNFLRKLLNITYKSLDYLAPNYKSEFVVFFKKYYITLDLKVIILYIIPHIYIYIGKACSTRVVFRGEAYILDYGLDFNKTSNLKQSVFRGVYYLYFCTSPLSVFFSG